LSQPKNWGDKVSQALASIPGEWQAWDQEWQEIATGPHAMLYTPDEPITVHQRNHRAYFTDLWNLAQGLRVDARFFELGAGRGTTSQYLAAKGCDVTLVDLAEGGLRLARHNFAKCGLPQPQCIVADCCDTGEPDYSADCVYSIGVLEHFEDPMPMLAESYRLLSEGGLLFHIIVQGTPEEAIAPNLVIAEEMPRYFKSCEWYSEAMQSLGMFCACYPYRIPGVYCLTGTKPIR